MNYWDYRKQIEGAAKREPLDFHEVIRLIADSPDLEEGDNESPLESGMADVYGLYLWTEGFKDRVKESGDLEGTFLELCDIALKDLDGFKAANKVVAHHLQKGLANDDMIAWAVMVLLGEIKPPKKVVGKSKLANLYRDLKIACLVADAESLGLKPTRNEASNRQSACDVVAELFTTRRSPISYSGVAKIWGRYKDTEPLITLRLMATVKLLHTIQTFDDLQL